MNQQKCCRCGEKDSKNFRKNAVFLLNQSTTTKLKDKLLTCTAELHYILSQSIRNVLKRRIKIQGISVAAGRWSGDSVKGKNIQALSRGYISGKEIKMYNDLKLMLKTAQLCLDETSWTKMLGLFYSSWEGERIPAYLPVSFTSHSEAERQQL